MSTLLEGLDGVEVIMDDILVHGRNRKEHDAYLNAVLRIINDSGLKLNPRKSVSRKRPNNVSKLRTVLGMFQYLAKFVYDMSVVSDETDD